MTPCKACVSLHRLWIEQLRSEGIPANIISRMLRDDKGESISGEGLRRHFRNHVDVSGALRDKYAASQTLRDVAAGRRLSDVQRLDAIIEDASRRAAETGREIDRFIADHKAPPMALVEAHKASMAESRQAIKQKADLLGDQPTDGVDRLLAALWGGESVSTPTANVEITGIIEASEEPPDETQ